MNILCFLNFYSYPGTPPHHTELATKMGNKSKRNQLITYNIHPQERQLLRNTHQSNSPTTGRIRKVLRTTIRLQTELESAHYQEAETN
jgi:hypothetical protein